MAAPKEHVGEPQETGGTEIWAAATLTLRAVGKRYTACAPDARPNAHAADALGGFGPPYPPFIYTLDLNIYPSQVLLLSVSLLDIYTISICSGDSCYHDRK